MWNKAVVAAIKAHCAAQGMTKDEVVQAVGKPAHTNPGNLVNEETWEYEKDIQEDECIKYEGDRCGQYKIDHKTTTYQFSPTGHLTYPYHDDIFGLNCFTQPFFGKYGKVFFPH